MVLWVVEVGVVDVESDVEVVRAVVVEAAACDDDEIDVIEDVLSPPVPVKELEASDDVSLSTALLPTSCALTRVKITSKRENIRETWVRASMMWKGCDHSHKF